MTYATLQDLIDRFGEEEVSQLADRDRDGEIDAAVIARALEEADALVDSYVARRYTIPLAETPVLLRRLAGDIARHALFKDDPPEPVSTAYRQAVSTLRDIAAGRALLNIEGDEPARSGDVVLSDGPDRTFSRDTLKGF